MVQFTGKYELVKNEGYIEYILAFGKSPESAETFAAEQSIIEISEAGGRWTIKDPKYTATFKFGEVYDDPMTDVMKIPSATKQEGDKIITETSLPDGHKTTRLYEFSDFGLIIRYSDTKTSKTAARHFKRI